MALCLTNLFPYMYLWVVTMYKEANLGFPYVHQIKAVVTYKDTLLFLWGELNVSSKPFKLINTNISMSNRCLLSRCSGVTTNWKKVKAISLKGCCCQLFMAKAEPLPNWKTSSVKLFSKCFYHFLNLKNI